MKTKFVSLIASAFAFAAFAAHAETTLSVAATAVPHAEILEHVKPVLAKEGITLKITQELQQCGLEVPSNVDEITDWVRKARGLS